MPTRRTFLATLAAGALFSAALPSDGARAAPIRYDLDPDSTRVQFGFRLAGTRQIGTVPVESADIVIDPANLAASRVDVRLRTARMRTGLFYATQALTGPQMLDVARYPTARFVSTRIRPGAEGRLSGGARLRGLLTLKDRTRPVELVAELYRPRGSAPDNLEVLTIRLNGLISRKAFGLTGYADLVPDPVTIEISATIRARR